MQQGIKVLQQKLAGMIKALTGAKDDVPGDEYEPRSPGMDGSGTAYGGMQQGYGTPYNGGAGAGQGWNAAGGATQYGGTPYGGGGWQ